MESTKKALATDTKGVESIALDDRETIMSYLEFDFQHTASYEEYFGRVNVSMK